VVSRVGLRIEGRGDADRVNDCAIRGFREHGPSFGGAEVQRMSGTVVAVPTNAFTGGRDGSSNWAARCAAVIGVGPAKSDAPERARALDDEIVDVAGPGLQNKPKQILRAPTAWLVGEGGPSS
jgi:hypothetical protein